MQILLDDLSNPQIAQLLVEHMEDMHCNNPPESVHALDLDTLKKPEITFWAAWEGNELAGCGAILELDSEHGEIKSMRTATAFRGQGVGSMILQTMIEHAKSRGYQRISLETGTADFFKPAHMLYQKFGFEFCGAFADYIPDEFCTYMTMEL